MYSRKIGIELIGGLADFFPFLTLVRAHILYLHQLKSACKPGMIS